MGNGLCQPWLFIKVEGSIYCITEMYFLHHEYPEFSWCCFHFQGQTYNKDKQHGSNTFNGLQQEEDLFYWMDGLKKRYHNHKSGIGQACVSRTGKKFWGSCGLQVSLQSFSFINGVIEACQPAPEGEQGKHTGWINCSLKHQKTGQYASRQQEEKWLTLKQRFDI